MSSSHPFAASQRGRTASIAHLGYARQNEARQGAFMVAQELTREATAGTIEVGVRDMDGNNVGHAVVTFTSN